jgi:hypothetical protein
MIFSLRIWAQLRLACWRSPLRKRDIRLERHVTYFGVRWQAVFRATPLWRRQEKRCLARLSARLVTALQRDLAISAVFRVKSNIRLEESATFFYDIRFENN